MRKHRLKLVLGVAALAALGYSLRDHPTVTLWLGGLRTHEAAQNGAPGTAPAPPVQPASSRPLPTRGERLNEAITRQP